MRYNAIFTTDDLSDFSKQVSYNIDSDQVAINNDISIPIHTDFGGMDLKMKVLSGLAITEWQSLFKKDTKVIGKLDTPVLSLHFILNGTTNFITSEFQTDVQGGSNNIWSLNGCSKGYSEYKRNVKYESWGINFNDDYLHVLVNRYPDLLSELYVRYSNGESFFLHQGHQKTSIDMGLIINQINNAELLGSASELYIESKVLEMLAMQLSDHSTLKKCCKAKNNVCQKSSDKEKIFEARDVLLTDIYNPPSLCELAKCVGINEKKLKYGFKEMFNHTVYGYLFEHKMQLASQLLLSTDKTIYEIGLDCGYDYASHFTTAFKRKHGISPKLFREQA